MPRPRDRPAPARAPPPVVLRRMRPRRRAPLAANGPRRGRLQQRSRPAEARLPRRPGTALSGPRGPTRPHRGQQGPGAPPVPGRRLGAPSRAEPQSRGRPVAAAPAPSARIPRGPPGGAAPPPPPAIAPGRGSRPQPRAPPPPPSHPPPRQARREPRASRRSTTPDLADAHAPESLDHFAHLDDVAGALGGSRHVHDQLDPPPNLVADRVVRQAYARHQGQRLEPSQRIGR